MNATTKRSLLLVAQFTAVLLFAQEAHADWVIQGAHGEEAHSTDAPKDDSTGDLTDEDRRIRREGAVTERLGVGGHLVLSEVSSRGGGGGALVLNRPIWLGTRYGAFQWVANTVGGASLSGGRDQVALFHGGVDFGFNLYLGSVFGFEIREGAVAAPFVGNRSAGIGVAARGSASYVFRFWKDDRQRLKLESVILAGAPVFESNRPSAGDLATTLVQLGMGLTYETPY